MSIEKMKADLSKLNDKIGQLQRKAKDMEERILQAENMEYLKIIRKNGISAEELQLMIDIKKQPLCCLPLRWQGFQWERLSAHWER